MKSERTKCRNDEIPKLTRSTAARNKMHGRMNHARDGPALSEFPMNPTIAGCGRVQAEVMLGSRRPQGRRRAHHQRGHAALRGRSGLPAYCLLYTSDAADE